MLSEENYQALTENQSVSFDSLLKDGSSIKASAQQQIAGCLYMTSCIQAALKQCSELEDCMAEPQKQEYTETVHNLTEMLSNVTLSFGKAVVTIDINHLDVCDYLLTFLKFVANDASIYYS